jgi:hypothetical protein
MTVHIGSLGTERPTVDAKFTYFGETIRVHPDASDLAYTEFLALSQDIEIDDKGQPVHPEDNARAASVLDEVLRGQIHPDDYLRFMKLARAHRQQTLDIMLLSQQIVSAVSGFPTGQPSGSRTGPDNEVPRLPGTSSDRATRRERERKQTKAQKKARRQAAVARAATVLSGRPDLQLMVMQRQETLDASA